MAEWLPGGVLPVNPSTLRDCRDLQKFYPSDYPSEGVSRDPSGNTLALTPSVIISPLIEFSEDSAPMPLAVVIAAGADEVEQDATETKLSEMSLHKFLFFFGLMLSWVFFTRRKRLVG